MVILLNSTKKMIEIDHWMTDFFGFPYAYVKGGLTEEDIQLHSGALLEWRIPIGDLQQINLATKLGFEMMEVMVDFETEIQPISENLPFFTSLSKRRFGNVTTDQF